MLWDYGNYNCFTLLVRGSTLDVVYRRQIEMSKVDPRTATGKPCPAELLSTT